MKVYRKNLYLMRTSNDVPAEKSGSRWLNIVGNKVPLVPVNNTVIYTKAGFDSVTIGDVIVEEGEYYRYDGLCDGSNVAKWTNISRNEAMSLNELPIFNIMEGTYSGVDMGERSITATIDFPSRIDFQIGDYVKFDIANLLRYNNVAGGHNEEYFYIYNMPTVKKVATSKSYGKAFQHTVTFYPRQYELAMVKMRDVLQETSSGVIYTGYDEFSFYGGANTLMKRIMAVLNERFGTEGEEGKDYWSYRIADSVNEDKNTALEKFQFDFSDSSVIDALMKLNDADGINTKFFINDRMIYVGYKRPYITGVDSNNIQRNVPFEFAYGKTSHMPIDTNHGNLFTLTKSNGSNMPITRLYAYGANRNLHRFYCSDRIKAGRYVNRLMLPSFNDDGRTDYVDSPEGIARFGIREGMKNFESIYPSLRFFYYGNLRDIKYCIKLMGSGLEGDADGIYDSGVLVSKTNLTDDKIKSLTDEWNRAKGKIEGGEAVASNFSFTVIINGRDVVMNYAQVDVLLSKGKVRVAADGIYQYPIARIQCYRVVELTRIENGEEVHTGINTLIESAPPVDLAVFCHATGKAVKCILYSDKGGDTSIERQLEADGQVPVDGQGNPIVGSCFAVHDPGFGCGHIDEPNEYPDRPDGDTREAWFQDADKISTQKDGIYYKPYDLYKNEVSIHQINYTDEHWITDVYEFESYNQIRFNRQGYSAYCWPRVNKYYPESQADNVEVNAIVDVGPVFIEDTDLNISEGQQQQTFDIYMRDMGFKINEQTWFGDRVFLFDTCKINFLDGNLAGYSFEMPAESDQAKLGYIYVPALNPDGSRNEEFFDMADDPAQAEEAYLKGAFWRIVAKRADTSVDRYYVPNIMLNAGEGDHVVFLDIFMPDIYVRVAEQRLLKEAKKYLDANDDGDIQYSLEIDKVRPNAQPIFALQMREGAIMRVVDDDLDVGTINNEKILFNDDNGLVSALSFIETQVDIDKNVSVVYREVNDIIDAGLNKYKIIYDSSEEVYQLIFEVLPSDIGSEIFNESITIFFYDPQIGITRRYQCNVDNILSIAHTGIGEHSNQYTITFKSIDFLDEMYHNTYQNFWYNVQYGILEQTSTIQTNVSVCPIGTRRYCHANSLIDFKANKYYEVIIDAMNPDMLVEDEDDTLRMFALANGLGSGEKIYVPEYNAEVVGRLSAKYTRFKISFTLGEEFNDDIDYYPSIMYSSNGETETVHVRLWSILERDSSSVGDANYVDLSIDTVTIKFNDNTREKNISLQDGQEPSRLTDNQTMMTRTITATVKEESRASGWAKMIERVEETEMLQEQTMNFYQSLVDSARKNYIEFLNLKNNLFDPDGTCNEVFLQVMMLQVGADSMNYQLKYTHYGMNGQRANCDIVYGSTETIDATGKYYDQFLIKNADEILDHYVYTNHPSGGDGGRWYPQEKNTFWPLYCETDGTNDTWPTYFIALKASLTDPRDCHWVCETTQHATNELVNGSTGYFYFNWGILVPDGYGHYALRETRGNAYMYGDNLICGTISTIAGNSYFDLTHGNFVLSQGTGGSPALSYINGVLTISGVNDGTADSIIERLKVVEMAGGENLFDGGMEYVLYWGHATSSQFFNEKYTMVANMTAGKYVIAYKSISARYQRNPSNPTQSDYDQLLSQFKVGFGYYDANDNYVELVALASPTSDFRQVVNLPINADIIVHLYGEISTAYLSTISTPVIKSIFNQFMFLYYDYRTYYEHLTNAIKGSTEIAGGLLLTNLLMLRDENQSVVAGMSGVTDGGDHLVPDGHGGVTVKRSEGVSMWSGGDYEGALNMALGIIHSYPIFFSKTGIRSKIGCFEIVSTNSAAIYSEDRKYRILLTAGADMSIKMQQRVSNKWTDLLIIDSNDITVDYEIYTLGRYEAAPWKLAANDGLSSSLLKFWGDNQTLISQINIPANCECDINSNMTLYIHATTSMQGIKLSHVNIYATVSLVKINGDDSYTTIASTTYSGYGESNIDSNTISWKLPLSGFNNSPYTLTSAGNYGILLTIDHFVRTNDFGVDYEEHMYNSNWADSVIDVWLSTDVHFSRNTSLDRTIMKIGRNGMLIAHSASSYFLAKNDSTNIDVQMGGLPTQQSDASPNGLYKSNGYLMIR